MYSIHSLPWYPLPTIFVTPIVILIVIPIIPIIPIRNAPRAQDYLDKAVMM